MLFYCPVCSKTVEVAPEISLTTKLNQQVLKAHCPTCHQDLALYGAGQTPAAVLPVQPEATEGDPQAAVDKALNEFGSTVT